MKKLLLLSTVFIVLALFLSAFTGCQEENLTDIKKARFIGNENRKLKAQLLQCQAEIEKCLQEKLVLRQERQKKIADVMNFFIEQKRRLDAQNEQLRQQLEELKNRE